MKTKHRVITDRKGEYDLVFGDVFYVNWKNQLVGLNQGVILEETLGCLFGENEGVILNILQDYFEIIPVDSENWKGMSIDAIPFGRPFVDDGKLVCRLSKEPQIGLLIDVKTGKRIWEISLHLEQNARGSLRGIGSYVFRAKHPSHHFKGDTFILARLDADTGRVIWSNSKDFESFSNSDSFTRSISLLKVEDAKVFLAYPGGVSPSLPPPRLIALDLATGTFIRHWEHGDFTTLSRDEPSRRYPNSHGFRPKDFQWDPKDEKFYLLGGSGLYSLDPRTGETGFSLHNEVFEQHQLQPSHSACLHGDHFYFNSFWEYVPDPIQEPGQRKRWTRDRETAHWSLGAFNIRTQQIDWQYDFPVGYIKNSLYAPKANDRYIVAHDTEKRLHVFEKLAN